MDTGLGVLGPKTDATFTLYARYVQCSILVETVPSGTTVTLRHDSPWSVSTDSSRFIVAPSLDEVGEAALIQGF